MSLWRFDAKRLWPAFLGAVVVVGLGAVQDWYQRSDYMTDAISYLDISKAIRDGEWSLVFNPYWSIGYPVAIASVRGLFAAGPQGEWTAVHVVNLIVYVSTYLSFLYLLKVAQAYLAKLNGVPASDLAFDFILVISTALFLLLQMVVNTASRANPDLLVNCVFFLCTAESLQFVIRPRIRSAVLLGLLMGFGYVVKAIFLPVAGFISLALLLVVLTRPRTERMAMISRLAWALPAMAVLMVPYIAANSMNAGLFTLGETGSLNYAWNVNHLPAGTHWQGGTDDEGMPIHPTKMVMTSPHVYVFSEPFHVTYPPWFNPFYWYQGYHHYFSIGKQLAALKKNLSSVFLRGPREIAVLVLTALGLIFLKQRMIWLKRILMLWPVYLPSLLAISGYMLAVIEPRYLVGFWLVLLSPPLIALFAPTPLVSRTFGYVLAAFISLACAAVVAEFEKDTFLRAIHHETYLSDEHWKVGLYLNQSGIRPGDKVASVHSGMDCTWAKVSGVQIVAEIPLGGANSVPRAQLEADFKLFARDAAVQQAVLALFKQAGATWVVVFAADVPVEGPAWRRVPGTDGWFQRL